MAKYVTRDLMCTEGSYAQLLIDKFLSSGKFHYNEELDCIDRVDPSVWKDAQVYENLTWQRESTSNNSMIDFWHSLFSGYSSLTDMTFRNAVEVGCGVFAQTSGVRRATKIEKITLTDPLLSSYKKLAIVSKEVSECVNCFNVTAENLGMLNEKFDLVICINVLQHCYDLHKAVESIRKSMCSGCVLIFADEVFKNVKENMKIHIDEGHPIKMSKKTVDWIFNQCCDTEIFRKSLAHPGGNFGSYELFIGSSK